MFWKVAGFSQPSPIEQILDKEEFTLEELLDEDDIIQECKSVNGRLVAFLRERSTVEQLLRYIVDPPLDADDPKRAYKYPFTACEVFCLGVEAVFNTLVEDPELLQILFSLLDEPVPLSSKTAGYFGRVVGNLLLRKTTEMMQFLQDHPQLLHQLVKHVETTSIAEILKRLVGADEQSTMLFLPQYGEWLADTPLSDLLLAKLAPGAAADAQSNAADILCAIAHTQPSSLASKLTQPASIAQLFAHALAPGQQVLVSALEVCIALIEPRRSAAIGEAAMPDAVLRAKADAVEAIVPYIPKLVEIMQQTTSASDTSTGTGAAITVSSLPSSQEAPYGLLSPPLGRARLKAVELLTVLLRSGSPSVEPVIISTCAVKTCLHLFASYPFNNLLHHCVVAMLVAILTKSSASMLKHIFEDCELLKWLTSLPTEIRPTPNPGQEELAATKLALRAGYMGHVTQIASTLESFCAPPQEANAEGMETAITQEMADTSATSPESAAAASETEVEAAGSPPKASMADANVTGADAAVEVSNPSETHAAAATAAGGEGHRTSVASYLESDPLWQQYLADVLQPRQELENVTRWACGRPTATELAGLDSDNDEFQQAEMELEQMVGMQPVLYHRYHVDDGEEDDENDDDEDDYDASGVLKGSRGIGGYDAQAVTDGISNIDFSDMQAAWQDSGLQPGGHGPFSMEDAQHGPAGLQGSNMLQFGHLSSARQTGMEDDEVLLASSDEEDEEGKQNVGSEAQPTGEPAEEASNDQQQQQPPPQEQTNEQKDVQFGGDAEPKQES